jgi:hypothetical protein
MKAYRKANDASTMKIADTVKTWFKEHDIAKKLIVIFVMILWCLIMMFYFHSSDEMFYRD